MIKVTPRAQVGPEVLEWYQKAARTKLEKIYNEVKALPQARQGRQIEYHKVVLTNLTDVARGNKEPGKGLDLVLARLRSLDYASIKIQQGFLMGFTRDLQIEEMGDPKWVYDPGFNYRTRGYQMHRHTEEEVVGYWDAGAYAVCISLRDFQSGNADNIHFIPQRKPRALDRHMHHYAYEGGGGPLKWSTNTCWGAFASVVLGALSDLDLVETMRSLRAFVGRFYNGSPLRNPRPSLYYRSDEINEWMTFKPNPGYDQNGQKIRSNDEYIPF